MYHINLKMDKIAASINYGLDEVEIPVIVETTMGDQDIFGTARQDIMANDQFTKEQRNHFGQFLDYLEKTETPECLGKHQSIVIGSLGEGNHHGYVKITNPNPEKTDVPMFFNYDPKNFQSTEGNLVSKWVGFTFPTLAVPTFCKDITKYTFAKKILFASDVFTVLNCMINTFLFEAYRDKNFTKKMIRYPYLTSFKMIIGTMFYCSVGLYLSKSASFYSRFIINGIIGFGNIWLYQKIMNGN